MDALDAPRPRFVTAEGLRRRVGEEFMTGIVRKNEDARVIRA